MRATLCRRLAFLERKFKPAKNISILDTEIRAMTASERCALRDFLLYAKNGGQSGDTGFDELKLAAENAVYAARGRLEIS
jgi:hypothetical protein